MNFKITKLEIENFRSIQDKVTLSLKPGLFSIEGINYPETNDNFQDNSYNQLNNYQDNNYMKEPENTLPNNDNYNYSDLNTPSSFNSDNYPDDFSSPTANQGELFQQPLDIIETNKIIYTKWLQSTNYKVNEDMNIEVYTDDNCYIYIPII